MVQSHINDCTDKSDFTAQGHCTDGPCILAGNDVITVQTLAGFGDNAMEFASNPISNKSVYGTLWLTLPNPEFWNTDEDLEIIVAVYPQGADRAPAQNQDNMHGLRVRDASRRTATLLWANYDMWKPTYSTHTGMFVLTTEIGLATDPSKGPDERTAWDTPIISTGRANLAKSAPDLLDGADGWAWAKITIESGVVSAFYHRSNSWSLTPPTVDYEWSIGSYDYSSSLGDITEIGIMGLNEFNHSGRTYFRNLQITTTLSGPIGFDTSIKFSSYTIRSALNAGGKLIVVVPNPFYSRVSAITLLTQLKKKITYINVFEAYQWVGESQSVDMSTHQAIYECEEMLIKTKFTEVGQSPIIFSTFLRQWNGLVIEDKDADFVNRGVTTSHILAFAKADTKVYEGRVTRDAFTIVETDFVTSFVPDIVNNGLDEEMYYWDNFNADDSTQAHIVVTDSGVTTDAFAVRYPVDLYEKFNNLTKLNKLEIKATISAIRGTTSALDWTYKSGDDGSYIFYIYNYQSMVFEKIQAFGKTDLKGNFIVSSTAADSYYTPIAISIDIINVLKSGVDLWLIGTTYTSGDRAIHNDVLYTYIDGTPSSGQEPPDTKWRRSVYDFINYESTAGSASIFSKLNTIPVIQTTVGFGIFKHGLWTWAFSMVATFDEDNEPEFSSASINAVAADGKSITLDATSGINLPEKDGFGVNDIVHIIKNAEDYLQDAWDASTLATTLGALNINVTGISSVGITDDHTTKFFFSLMQKINELTNATFWANYGEISTVEMESADLHSHSGITLTRDDIYNYNSGGWNINYDASVQKNAIRIIGDNTNFILSINPSFDPFDLGDETVVISDSGVQTEAQAKTKAVSLTPRLEGIATLITVDLNFTNPFQNYSGIKVGKLVTLQIPTSASATIFDDDLLIIAIDLNRNEGTDDQEITSLTLQFRWS